jgi:LPS-assembly lipoprotein
LHRIPRTISWLAFSLVAVASASCGFRPLYGADASGAAIVAEFGAMRIGELDERLGQMVRNELLDLVTPLGEPADPRYILQVDLFEEKQGLAIERDATITRFNLTLTANYDLLDARTRARVISGTVRATAAYNVLRAEFANVIAERDAEARTARVVAEEIKTRLSIYFSRLQR